MIRRDHPMGCAWGAFMGDFMGAFVGARNPGFAGQTPVRQDIALTLTMPCVLANLPRPTTITPQCVVELVACNPSFPFVCEAAACSTQSSLLLFIKLPGTLQLGARALLGSTLLGSTLPRRAPRYHWVCHVQRMYRIRIRAAPFLHRPRDHQQLNIQPTYDHHFECSADERRCMLPWRVVFRSKWFLCVPC